MSEITRSKATRKKAQMAQGEPAPQGVDIDLDAYSHLAEEHPYQEDLSRISSQDKERILEAGVMLDDLSQRSGTFLQIDHSVVHSEVEQEGLELMSTVGALETYPWLSDYWWKAVSPDADKFTDSLVGQMIAELEENGRFRVIERERLESLLSESEFSLSDLADSSNAAEIGRLLGVDALCFTNIAEVNDNTKRARMMIA